MRFLLEVCQWPLDGIILLGRSIGCCPAVALAAEYKVYGLILIAPFLSVQDLVKDHLGVVSSLMSDKRFPNKDLISKVSGLLLIVHGMMDSVVPYQHGKKLFHLCRSRKRLVCPEKMEHNTNLHQDAAYFVMPVLQFFSLPDYCFETIRIPMAFYDKARLAAPPQGVPLKCQVPRILTDETGGLAVRNGCNPDMQKLGKSTQWMRPMSDRPHRPEAPPTLSRYESEGSDDDDLDDYECNNEPRSPTLEAIRAKWLGGNLGSRQLVLPKGALLMPDLPAPQPALSLPPFASYRPDADGDLVDLDGDDDADEDDDCLPDAPDDAIGFHKAPRSDDRPKPRLVEEEEHIFEDYEFGLVGV
eukprot:TRINITY_DN4339_c0_g1_i2.p1 TRINITY_DN4339_c0_g1~~TRINITY_DN4339_c0_g1_i2.p1  ORF type:complete len:357 (+),score=58.03 TRINITY_DN4339_c0_g1_i2:257-1327(+)